MPEEVIDAEYEKEKERNPVTYDARTGEPIYDLNDAVAIMEENETVEIRSFTTAKGVIEKPVRFRRTLGWILKKNLKPTDITREDYLKEMGKQPYYKEIGDLKLIEYLSEIKRPIPYEK